MKQRPMATTARRSDRIAARSAAGVSLLIAFCVLMAWQGSIPERTRTPAQRPGGWHVSVPATTGPLPQFAIPGDIVAAEDNAESARTLNSTALPDVAGRDLKITARCVGWPQEWRDDEWQLIVFAPATPFAGGVRSNPVAVRQSATVSLKGAWLTGVDHIRLVARSSSRQFADSRTVPSAAISAARTTAGHLEIEFALSPGGTLAGVVVTNGNEPVADVEVRIRGKLDSGERVYRQTVTDPAGAFRFDGLQRGEYGFTSLMNDVGVCEYGYGTARVHATEHGDSYRFPVGDANSPAHYQELIIHRWVVWKLVADDPADRRAGQACCFVHEPAGNWRADGLGEWQFRLPPDARGAVADYLVVLEPSTEGQEFRIARGRASADDDVHFVTFVPTRSAQAQVVDSCGVPVPGAEVELFDASFGVGTPAWRGQSDESGWVAVPELPAASGNGDVRVAVVSASGVIHADTTVAALATDQRIVMPIPASQGPSSDPLQREVTMAFSHRDADDRLRAIDALLARPDVQARTDLADMLRRFRELLSR